MKKSALFILKISRPHFWVYLWGPFLIGYLLGLDGLAGFSWKNFLPLFIYFITFANLLVYSVNDYFDLKTDILNPKKRTREYLARDLRERKYLRIIIAVCLAVSMVFFMFLSKASAKILLTSFIFLAFFYSAPPLRFKSKPFLDFSSNILYGLPGFLGYFLSNGNLPNIYAVIAVYLWTSAMHLFSAVPDIEYDKKALVLTTAVRLGYSASLKLCFIFWFLFFLILVGLKFYYPFSFALAIYPFMALTALYMKEKIQAIYWFFPLLNACLGFVGFMVVVADKV